MIIKNCFNNKTQCKNGTLSTEIYLLQESQHEVQYTHGQFMSICRAQNLRIQEREAHSKGRKNKTFVNLQQVVTTGAFLTSCN